MSVNLDNEVVKAADYNISVAGSGGGGLELTLGIALSSGGCLEFETESMSRSVSGGCQ